MGFPHQGAPMTNDAFAKIHTRGTRRGWITAAAFALLAVVVIGVWLGAMRVTAEAKAREWMPAGTPCPAISQAAYLASGFSATNRVDFDGVGFSRAYGYIVCSDIADDGGRSPVHAPVCQFNDPGALDIATADGHTYYLPQTKPATVIVSRGRAACVLAANQHMDSPGG
jgi:hypothetical protein